MEISNFFQKIKNKNKNSINYLPEKFIWKKVQLVYNFFFKEYFRFLIGIHLSQVSD